MGSVAVEVDNRNMADRRSPSYLKIIGVVSLITAVLVSTGTFVVTRLATDYLGVRDNLLWSHDSQIRTIMLEQATIKAQLSNMEKSQDKIEKTQDKILAIIERDRR